MTVGLPGTGIGGFFYILCALWMPFHELYRKLRRPDEPRRWRLAFTQFSIAALLLGGLSLVGWMLGMFSAPESTGSAAPQRAAALGVSALAVTLGVLFALLALVEIVRLRIGKPTRRRRVVKLPSAGRIGR